MENQNTTTGLDYAQYRQAAIDSLENGNIRGGEEMRDYVSLNNRRMDRAEKTFSLDDELKSVLDNLGENHTLLILTEPWCGDASQSVPVLAKIAEQSDKLKAVLIHRDENLELMDRYLTNGGRAIPKAVIVRDSDGSEVADWGPRPTEAQQIVLDWKAAGGQDKDKMIADVQKWYAKDRGKTIQKELVKIFSAL